MSSPRKHVFIDIIGKMHSIFFNRQLEQIDKNAITDDLKRFSNLLDKNRYNQGFKEDRTPSLWHSMNYRNPLITKCKTGLQKWMFYPTIS
uniref:Putative ovule protein n=1 Tax=Solanum chacoense TaxID=4108 RepID=A0A0V0GWR5_SOLCH